MKAPYDMTAITGLNNKAVIKKGEPIKLKHTNNNDGSVSTLVLGFDRKSGLVRRATLHHDSRSEMAKTFAD